MHGSFLSGLLVLVTLTFAGLRLDAALARPIFDGKTFAGWEGDTNKWWRIEQGALVGGSLKERMPYNDFLATTRSYTNFLLRAQFRLLGSEGFVNSGIQIRSQRVPNSHEMIGYQCDIGDPTWWGSIYDESRRNKVLAQSDMEALNKVLKRGEWNEYTIRAEGRRIRTYINGVLGVDYTEPDESIPQWGRIGMQVHGGGTAEAWFKDVTLEELPLAKASPLSPEEERASFHLPDGFEAEWVVAEPDLPKPITVTWDDAGRMWSMTALEYPVDANESPSEAEALFRGGGRDQIMVFEHSERAGPVAGRAYAGGLAIPLGLLPYKDGAFVQYGTQVLFIRDTDGDGRGDKREVVLEGFGVQDSHLFPHQFTRAPGGWIYLAQGAFNYSNVRAKNGVVVQFNQTKLARFRPDGSAFEILTHGPCNIWGLVINRFGETFIQEANDYGYPVIPYQAGMNIPGCGDHKFRDYAPVAPSIADAAMGGTGLSGLALSEDPDAFPDPWNDVMFVANPIVRAVQAVKIHRSGSGYKLERLADFMTSQDDWFRPIAIHFGPDGCLYVVDWYNKIISHNEVPRNHPDRDKSRGRVWRVRHRDQARSVIPNVASAPDGDLMRHLASARGWEWRAALNQIGDRPSRGLAPQLIAWLTRPESVEAKRVEPAALQIRALWALENLDQLDRGLLSLLMQSPDRNVRREAVRAAGEQWAPAESLDLLKPLAQDPDHQVRAEVIRTASGQIAPWKHLIMEGADRAPDPPLSFETIELLIRMAGPPLPEPNRPGPGYERAFERYLIRAALERHPRVLADYLGSPSARTVPVENRLFAALALPGSDAAARLAASVAEMSRAYHEEEFQVLLAHSGVDGVSTALELAVVKPEGAAALARAALSMRTRLEVAGVEDVLTSLAGDLLGADSPTQTLGLRLAGAFKLAKLEPTMTALLESGNLDVDRQILVLQSLQSMRNGQVDLLERWAADDSRPESVRREAIAALAAHRKPEASQRLLGLWPGLAVGQRQSVLAQLASSKQGARTLLAAVDEGIVAADELGFDTLENMRSLLERDAGMERLWDSMSGRMKRVLRLSGGPGDFAPTQIRLEGPFTVETWIKLDPGISNHDGILGHPGGADLNFYNGQFRFFAGEPLHDVVVAQRKTLPNTWTHVAVTRDASGEFRLYIQGELDAVGTRRSRGVFSNLDIGRTIPGDGGTSGVLTEFRVWNVARTAEEMLRDFDRSYEGEAKPEHLIHYFANEDSWGPLKGRARLEASLDVPPLLTSEQSLEITRKFERFQQFARSAGDPKDGHELFTVTCQVCHRVHGEGSELAPPLDGAAHRGVEGLLRAMLTPNAAIESGYRRFRVETRDGEIAEGFLVSRDIDGVVVRLPNVGDQRIPTRNIKSAGFQPHSIMPEGLLESMTPAQVSNLFAYLTSLK